MKGTAALFDLDGVLVDSSRFHFQAWQRWADEAAPDHPVNQAWFRRTFGQRNDAILAALFEKALTRAELEALSDRKEELFRDLARGRLEALPGAGELVRALQQAGWRLAVGTSTPPRNLEMVLESLGLSGCFPVQVTGIDVQRGKPDPEVFLQAANRLGVPPRRCVVVEDAEVGVEAARRAGMACLAVTTTCPPDRLWRADQVVASLTEVSPASLAQLVRTGRQA